MGDDASKLRQQIAFLSGLIKTHKQKPTTQTTESPAIKLAPGIHVTSDRKKGNPTLHKSHPASHIHGWLRPKQPVGKSAYSLDRRKLDPAAVGFMKSIPSTHSSAIRGCGTLSSSSLKWTRKKEIPQSVTTGQERHAVQPNPQITQQQAKDHTSRFKLNSASSFIKSETTGQERHAVQPDPQTLQQQAKDQTSRFKLHSASGFIKQRGSQVANEAFVRSKPTTAHQLNNTVLSTGDLSNVTSNPYVLHKRRNHVRSIKSEVNTPEKGFIFSQSKVSSNHNIPKKGKKDHAPTEAKVKEKIKGVPSARVKPNPYILNKKEGIHIKNSSTCIPRRTALQWKKSGTSVPSSTAGSSKSQSDSELFPRKTKEAESGRTAGVPLQRAVTQNERTSIADAGHYRWKKPQQVNWMRGNRQDGAKLTMGSRSSGSRKRKWTSTSVTQNPYVLKKQTGKNSKEKTVPTRRGGLRGSARGLPSKNQHVWRSKHLLKLDRRKHLTSDSTSLKLQKPQASFIQRRKSVVLQKTPAKPHISRFSVIRSKPAVPIQRGKASKVVFIGGVAYQSSTNKLARAVDRKSCTASRSSPRIATAPGKSTLMVHINGQKFVMDRTGRTLKRVTKPRHDGKAAAATFAGEAPQRTERRASFSKVVIGGVTFSQAHPGTLVRAKANAAQTLASRVLRRSLKTARVLKRKDQPKYCMFYNRFGKCNKGDKCPFIHDPSKVAVCTKFLRGKCKNTDGSCPFSHKVDPDKMPVCQFFLRGTCSSDSCPYSHVNVSKTAAVCEEFVAGYCPRGQKCKKKHILDCEEFKLTGACSKGKKCRLVHRKRKERTAKRKSSAASASEEPEQKRVNLDTREHEGFLPLARPDESAANTDGHQGESQRDSSVELLPIRPRFLKLGDA